MNVKEELADKIAKAVASRPDFDDDDFNDAYEIGIKCMACGCVKWKFKTTVHCMDGPVTVACIRCGLLLTFQYDLLDRSGRLLKKVMREQEMQNKERKGMTDKYVLLSDLANEGYGEAIIRRWARRLKHLGNFSHSSGKWFVAGRGMVQVVEELSTYRVTQAQADAFRKIRKAKCS